MFSQKVPCRNSASNASCFRFASALGIHDEYSDVLFSLLTLFTMCCLWFATTLPFACQWVRALLSYFVKCRQGVWKWNGSGFCFSESTSSMPARDWQCRGQSFLLLVLSKDNVLLQSSLCSPRDWQCRGQSFPLLVLSRDNVLLQSSLCSNGCGTDDDDDDDDDHDDMPIGRCELELR